MDATKVLDLAIGKGFAFRSRGRIRLNGFDSTVPAYEVPWQQSRSSSPPREQEPVS